MRKLLPAWLGVYRFRDEKVSMEASVSVRRNRGGPHPRGARGQEGREMLHYRDGTTIMDTASHAVYGTQ